jgi:epsilon-lactone hydrolase
MTYEGFWEEIAELYADGWDLKDPLLSPIYGDLGVFHPPSWSAARAMFLANTACVQRKLLQAGVPTRLEVEEGQSHMHFLIAAML